jgi:Protein of unknown function (DUF2924)
LNEAEPSNRESIGALGQINASDKGSLSSETIMLHHQNENAKLEHLERLSRAELRTIWEQELAEKPPLSLGRDILALGIAYARQERRHGGLPRPVARELDRLLARVLRDDGIQATAASHPLPRYGTVLVREWSGVTHHVTVVADGFLWNGKTYRSLSSVARTITGTNWNGPRFFGMRELKRKAPEANHGS